MVTAARYELLETSGVFEFAGAQVATNAARMLIAQLAGLLTDNLPLKRLYVASEASHLLLALLMYLVGQRKGVLFGLNVGLGLLFAFSQPVTKSMPPAVARKEHLAMINSWDLTCDKIGRYLAPIAYAVASSSHGFETAVLFSVLFYALLTIGRGLVRVSEPFKGEEKGERPTAPWIQGL